MCSIWFWVCRVPWPEREGPFWRNAIAEYSHLFTPSSSHSSFRFFHIICSILPPSSSHLSRSDRWPAIFVVRPFSPLPSSFNHVANIMRCFHLLLHFPRGDGGRFFVHPSLSSPPLCVNMKVISDQDDGKGHSTVLLLAQISPHKWPSPDSLGNGHSFPPSPLGRCFVHFHFFPIPIPQQILLPFSSIFHPLPLSSLGSFSFCIFRAPRLPNSPLHFDPLNCRCSSAVLELILAIAQQGSNQFRKALCHLKALNSL